MENHQTMAVVSMIRHNHQRRLENWLHRIEDRLIQSHLISPLQVKHSDMLTTWMEFQLMKCTPHHPRIALDLKVPHLWAIAGSQRLVERPTKYTIWMSMQILGNPPVRLRHLKLSLVPCLKANSQQWPRIIKESLEYLREALKDKWGMNKGNFPISVLMTNGRKKMYTLSHHLPKLEKKEESKSSHLKNRLNPELISMEARFTENKKTRLLSRWIRISTELEPNLPRDKVLMPNLVKAEAESKTSKTRTILRGWALNSMVLLDSKVGGETPRLHKKN